MKHTKAWLALSSLVFIGCADAAQSDLSATVAVTNDYDFRGVSKSAEDPALQARVDYSRDNWYVGAWGSNVDFGPGTGADLELDLYGGFTGKTEMGLGWDAGLVVYTYDKGKYNFPEIYTAFTYEWFKAKLAYSNDFNGDLDGSRHRSAWYVSGDANVPLPVKDLSFLAHLGHSFGNYWDHAQWSDGSTGSYTDYSIGVGYRVQKINLALKYVNTDAPASRTHVFNNEGRLILTASTTFPW